MPQRHTTYTFSPKDIKVDSKLVYAVIKYLDEQSYERILEEYKIETLNVETLKKIIKDLISENSVGWDNGGKNAALYGFVEGIFSDSNLNSYFNFVEIDEEWDDEGSDRYYYYNYISSEDVIKEAKSEIEKQIKVLEKYGKKVTFKVA